MTRDELLKVYFSQPRFPAQHIVDFLNLDTAGQDATLKAWSLEIIPVLETQIAANRTSADAAEALKIALEALP